jgi:hypothetical protein
MQRWLDRALLQAFAQPSGVRVQQEGSMEVRGNWTPFAAEGSYRVSPLSFEWKARLQMLPGVWIVAEDGHRDGQGWGGARLWGIVPMGRRTDPPVLITQVVRNLAELVWTPSFALADESLSWTDVGENAFEVRTQAGGREVMVRFEINDAGDMVQAWSPARPYDVPGGFEEAPWGVVFGDHQEYGGIRAPGSAVATYEKDDGPWEYMRVKVTAIVPET